MPEARHSQLKKTAYHEAGHAVAGYLLQRRLVYATIVPDRANGCRGLVKHVPLDEPKLDTPGTRATIEREILLLGAGEAAESRLIGRRCLAGAVWDREAALYIAGYVTGSDEEASAYINWLWARARNMLAGPPNWRAVEALAEALLRRRTLGAPDVEAVIRHALSTREEQLAMPWLSEPALVAGDLGVAMGVLEVVKRPNPDEVITLVEAARISGLGVSTLDTQRRKGRITRRELHRYLASRDETRGQVAALPADYPTPEGEESIL